MPVNAFRHGKTTGFLIEDATGTLIDLSSDLREVTFPRTIDMPESTTFQSVAKQYVQGLPDGKFTAAGFFDNTLDATLTRMSSLDGPPSTAANDTYAKGQGWGFMFKYAPEGIIVNRTVYVGRVFVANYSLQASIGGLVAATIEFVFSGQKAYSADASNLVRTQISAITGSPTTAGIWNAAVLP